MIIFINFLLSLFIQGHGFSPQTLVKTSQGYQIIESLQINDEVICCDLQTGAQYTRPITEIKRTKQKSYLVFFHTSFALIGQDQYIFIPEFHQWIPIKKLNDPEYFSQQTLVKKIFSLQDEILIEISVAEYHNFYITQDDILVHNTPALVFTMAAESILPAILSSATIATYASYLGIKAYKKNKQQQILHQEPVKKEPRVIINHYDISQCDVQPIEGEFHKICVPQEIPSLGSICPEEPQQKLVNICPVEDDQIEQEQEPCCQESPVIELEVKCIPVAMDDSVLTMGEKLKPKGYKQPENPRSNPNKKKHGKPEDRYKNNPLGRPLTDPEAREKAKEFGMQQTWDYPFDSHGRAVFTADHVIFITPDADGHKGGVWKMYNRDQRIGTFDINLENQLGD